MKEFICGIGLIIVLIPVFLLGCVAYVCGYCASVMCNAFRKGWQQASD